MKYPYSINWATNRTSVAARMPDRLPLIFYSNFYFYEKFRTLVISIRDHGLSLLLNSCMLPVPDSIFRILRLHCIGTSLAFWHSPLTRVTSRLGSGSATQAVKRAHSRLGVLVQSDHDILIDTNILFFSLLVNPAR